jgi:hypothetical protein
MRPAVDWLWKIDHKEMAACRTASYAAEYDPTGHQ